MNRAPRLKGASARATSEGMTAREVFQAFVGDVLGPPLRPSEVVILDQLSPDKDTSPSRT